MSAIKQSKQSTSRPGKTRQTHKQLCNTRPRKTKKYRSRKGKQHQHTNDHQHDGKCNGNPVNTENKWKTSRSKRRSPKANGSHRTTSKEARKASPKEQGNGTLNTCKQTRTNPTK